MRHCYFLALTLPPLELPHSTRQQGTAELQREALFPLILVFALTGQEVEVA